MRITGGPRNLLGIEERKKHAANRLGPLDSTVAGPTDTRKAMALACANLGEIAFVVGLRQLPAFQTSTTRRMDFGVCVLTLLSLMAITKK